MHNGWLWAALLAYGLVMFLVSPRAKRFGEFFESRTAEGKEVGFGMLVASVVITWLFAKSITNSANLSASYGLVGAVAYAGWYLSIPVAGVVIWFLRR
ncbi:MAG: sodium:solute symporter, partial [Gemmatimonadetes bacterium]|nr:sodium:solute symporter [Gemmatimonadota bacterium]